MVGTKAVTAKAPRASIRLLFISLILLPFVAVRWQKADLPQVQGQPGKLAYVGPDNNLWLTSLEGATQRQLTSGGGYAEPAWSPDGQFIAFVHSNKEVGFVKPDGSEQQILVKPEVDAFTGSYPYIRNPRWSLDGRYVFYQENTGGPSRNAIRKVSVADGQIDQSFSLWGYSFDVSPVDGQIVYTIINPSSSGGEALNLADATGANTRTLVSVQKDVLFAHPRWSPNGALIGFLAQGGQYGSGAIVVSASDGSQLRVLARDAQPGPDGSDWATLAWTSDGNDVVYEAGGILRLVSMIDGSVRNLVSGRDPAVAPASGYGLLPGTPTPVTGTPSGTIAYIGADGNIWTIRADGTAQTKLTSVGRDSAPAWSPDGKRIAFVSDRGGGSALFVMDADGGNVRQFTQFASGSIISQPYWSPDGQHIAFSWNKSQLADLSIFWINSDGTSLTKLISYSGNSWSGGISWSPDSRQLLFSVFAQSVHVSIINLDGSGLRTLISSNQHDYLPAWSPDGKWIAFERHSTNSPGDLVSDIFVADANGSGQYKLDDNVVGACYPIWSPDSKVIAYSSCVGAGLYVADIETRQQTRISDIRAYDWSWSPDGRWLVGSYYSKIYLVEVKTDQNTFLVDGGSPAWQPVEAATPSVSLDQLIATKQSVIPNMETTSFVGAYNTFSVPLSAYDEIQSRQLISDLQRSPAPSAEQAAAFARLVMQEQALAQTLSDYGHINNFQADVGADLSGLFWGTAFLAAKAPLGLGEILSDLVLKTLKDLILLVTGYLGDSYSSGLVGGGISAGFDYYQSHSTGDNGATYFQLFSEVTVREIIARQNIGSLVTRVQPTLDKSIRTVRGSVGDMWTLTEPETRASLQMEAVTNTSRFQLENAQSWHTSLGHGRNVNELAKDIADVMTLGKINYALVASIWTRVQQVAIDWFEGERVLAPAMGCIAQISERTGSLAFNPQQQAATCAIFRGQSSSHFLLARLAPAQPSIPSPIFSRKLQANADTYLAAIQALQTAVASGNAQTVGQAVANLALAQTQLNQATDTATAFSVPAAGRDWVSGAETVASTTVTLDLEAVGLWIDLAAYQDDPSSADAKTQLDGAMAKVATGAANWAQSLQQTTAAGAAPTEGFAVFGEVPSQIDGMVGQPVSLTVQIQNVGTSTLDGATLDVDLGGSSLDSKSVPVTGAGQVAYVRLSFVLKQAESRILVLSISDGVHRDLRFVRLKVVEPQVDQNSVSQPHPNLPAIALISAGICLLLLTTLLYVRQRGHAPGKAKAVATRCYACGHIMSARSAYCPHCGAKL